MPKRKDLPSTPLHRRSVALLAGFVLSAIVMTGCVGGQATPDSYTDGVRTAFIRGCVDITASDEAGTNPGNETEVSAALKEQSEEARAAVSDYCTCVYGQIKEKVKFARFKEVNSDLTDDRGPLPADIQRAYASCDKPSG